MFSGGVVWRGLIYTILMTFGKLACGLWLVRLSVHVPRKGPSGRIEQFLSSSATHFWGRRTKRTRSVNISPAADSVEMKKVTRDAQGLANLDNKTSTGAPAAPEKSADQIQPVTNHSPKESPNRKRPTSPPQSNILTPAPKKPISLYPASILGLAMVARGEIGFLISSVAESNGIFTSATSGSDDIFLIVTWAIVLCTIIGPVGVGLLVRRVKRLEKEKEGSGSRRDVLGVWGVG
jgi:hypothetical protein